MGASPTSNQAMRSIVLMLMILPMILVAGGCATSAHDVQARWPGPVTGGTATLVLRFTSPVQHAHVSINGTPVAEDAHTQRLVIEGIPPGHIAVVLAADGMEKVFSLELQPGQRVVMPLAGPPEGSSASRIILQAIASAVFYAAYATLSAAL